MANREESIQRSRGYWWWDECPVLAKAKSGEPVAHDYVLEHRYEATGWMAEPPQPVESRARCRVCGETADESVFDEPAIESTPSGPAYSEF